jgi:hypothetical protein
VLLLASAAGLELVVVVVCCSLVSVGFSWDVSTDGSGESSGLAIRRPPRALERLRSEFMAVESPHCAPSGASRGMTGSQG